MTAAAVLYILLFLVLPVVLVGGLFIWAAIRDGRFNRAVHDREKRRGSGLGR
jgi:hypothetical protein